MKQQLSIITILIVLLTNPVLAKTANENCVEISRTCVEGQQTKIINDTAIYKDCWSYKINYQCQVSDDFIDNCEQIKKISDCSQLSSICQSSGDNGNCITWLNKFICTSPVNNPSSLNLKLVNQDQHIISEIIDDSACAIYKNNPSCKKSTSLCQKASESRIINGLEVKRDCWEYKQEYACKEGFIDDCINYEENCRLDNSICLKNDENGNCTYRNNKYSCLVPTNQINLSCGSQNYLTTNQNQAFTKAAANLAILQESAKELDKKAMTTFSGSSGKCSKDSVNANNCCTMGGWSHDSSRVVSRGRAILDPSGAANDLLLDKVIGDKIPDPVSAVTDSLFSCSTEEKKLSYLRTNQMCVYIGSYCDKEAPMTGLCLSKKESYCCFKSKLSRLINEQGRRQISKGWGTPEIPDCSGITIDELKKIDFSQMDFSELYEDFLKIAKIPNASSMSNKVSSTVQNYYRDTKEGGQ